MIIFDTGVANPGYVNYSCH